MNYARYFIVIFFIAYASLHLKAMDSSAHCLTHSRAREISAITGISISEVLMRAERLLSSDIPASGSTVRPLRKDDAKRTEDAAVATFEKHLSETQTTYGSTLKIQLSEETRDAIIAAVAQSRSHTVRLLSQRTSPASETHLSPSKKDRAWYVTIDSTQLENLESIKKVARDNINNIKKRLKGTFPKDCFVDTTDLIRYLKDAKNICHTTSKGGSKMTHINQKFSFISEITFLSTKGACSIGCFKNADKVPASRDGETLVKIYSKKDPGY